MRGIKQLSKSNSKIQHCKKNGKTILKCHINAVQYLQNQNCVIVDTDLQTIECLENIYSPEKLEQIWKTGIKCEIFLFPTWKLLKCYNIKIVSYWLKHRCTIKWN